MKNVLLTLALAVVAVASAPLAKADHDGICRLEYYDEYGQPVYHGYGFSRYSPHFGYHLHTPVSYYRDEGYAPRYADDRSRYYDNGQRHGGRTVIVDRDDHRDDHKKHKKKKKHDDDDRRRWDPPGPHRLLERLFR